MPVGFSKVKIFNMALSNVGSQGNVEDADENTPEAKVCSLWYDAARIETLEAYNWYFARRSQTLAEHSVAAPTNRWAYRYQFPSDCVTPRYIENPAGETDADALPFEMEDAGDETISIVTDQKEAVLVYTRNVENVGLFTMHFTKMLAVALARLINSELTGKFGIYDRLDKRFQEMQYMAPAVDASSNVPRLPRDAGAIRARN